MNRSSDPDELEKRLHVLEKYVNDNMQFVGEMVNVLGKQKDLNVHTYAEIDTHLQIMKMHQGVIKELQQAFLAFRTLFTEHEMRLKNIELSLRDPITYPSMSIVYEN